MPKYLKLKKTSKSSRGVTGKLLPIDYNLVEKALGKHADTLAISLYKGIKHLVKQSKNPQFKEFGERLLEVVSPKRFKSGRVSPVEVLYQVNNIVASPLQDVPPEERNKLRIINNKIVDSVKKLVNNSKFAKQSSKVVENVASNPQIVKAVASDASNVNPNLKKELATLSKKYRTVVSELKQKQKELEELKKKLAASKKGSEELKGKLADAEKKIQELQKDQERLLNDVQEKMELITRELVHLDPGLAQRHASDIKMKKQTLRKTVTKTAKMSLICIAILIVSYVVMAKVVGSFNPIKIIRYFKPANFNQLSTLKQILLVLMGVLFIGALILTVVYLVRQIRQIKSQLTEVENSLNQLNKVLNQLKANHSAIIAQSALL